MPDQQVSAYPRHAIFIRREVEFGEVYFVKDNLISIPDADRVVEGRTRHDSRRVLIAQNDETNYTNYPVVLVAPLTTRTDTKRRFDIELRPPDEPVDKPALVRLKLLQPILRVDLGSCAGMLSREKQGEVMAALLSMFGHECPSRAS